MNIGIITAEVDASNGWAQMSLSIIAGLRDLGLPVRVVGAKGTAGADFAILPRLAKAERGVLLQQAITAPAVVRALSDCDIVHTLVEPFAPLGVLVAGRRPHILTVAGTYAALPLMRRFPVGSLYRWAFERSTAVCISRYTQTIFEHAAPHARSVVIRNGVDAVGLMDRAKELAPFPKRGPLVLFVGAVKERKGAIHLIRAMKRVCEANPNASCIIIGSVSSEPAYVQKIRAEIDHLSLTEKVSLLGHVSDEDLLRWYKTADVLVVPSMNAGWRFEGFGLIYLEAGVFGVPAIGTRECGASDAIDDGKTGFLVSQSHVDTELPEAILHLLGDETLRKEIGEANRVRAFQASWIQVAKQYLALYEEVLTARR